MWFRVLGPLEVASTTITSERQQIILTMCLLETGRVVSIDRLIRAVWGDDPPATAREQVHNCVSQLRKVLTCAGLPEIIATVSPGYLTRVPDEELDLRVFERLVRDARRAVGEQRYPDADDLYRQALSLWRGTVTTADSELLRAAVLRLTECRIAVAEEWADVRLQLGRHHELVTDLLELVSEFPLREELRAKLMLALYRAGRQAEALETYRTGRRLLIEELGIEPGERLRRMENEILTGTLATESHPPAGHGPTTGRPSPSRPAPTPAVPRTLPRDTADLTGRDALARRIRGLLLPGPGETAPADPAPTAVAVTGRAGVGKTSLAVRVGHQLAPRFPDGQLFVDLAGSSTMPVPATDALERCLRTLGLPPELVPDRLLERAELYRQLLADRRLLVLLDDAADEEHVRWLLPGGAASPVIVTSRYRLTGLPGTTTVEVDVISHSESLRLLAGVAGRDRIEAEPAEASRLVTYCGGLPLALRVTAARLAARPHWSVRRLAERLADERRRLDELTLRDLSVRISVDPTYARLSPPARRLFRRLGVPETVDFPGWLAAPLLDAPVAGAEEVLEELVEAHLVDPVPFPGTSEVRFRLHGLFRTYARERLAREEPAGAGVSALTRCAGAWLHLAEEALRRGRGGGGGNGRFRVTGPRWRLPGWVLDRELGGHPGWYERECDNLRGTARQAERAGLHWLGHRLTRACEALARGADHCADRPAPAPPLRPVRAVTEV